MGHFALPPRARIPPQDRTQPRTPTRLPHLAKVRAGLEVRLAHGVGVHVRLGRHLAVERCVRGWQTRPHLRHLGTGGDSQWPQRQTGRGQTRLIYGT